jgi:hypothetical protein
MVRELIGIPVGGVMKSRSILWSGLAAVGVLAGAATMAVSGWPATALAQPSPEPPECNCSRGLNLATNGAPVLIRHCQCGILTCAVVVSSGQLQCTP